MKFEYLLALIVFLLVLAMAYWALLDWEGFIAFWNALNRILFE